MKRNRTHDEYLQEVLKDPQEAALYLTAAAEEDDPALLQRALSQVARAHGVTHMANKVAMSRTGMHKTLSKDGNPEFKTLLGILRAVGLQMTFKPLEEAA